MSTYKEHVTKGLVHILPRDTEKVVSVDDKAGIAIMSGYLRDDRQREANASLIAEAFNVLHETGYTPAELAEQVAALLRGLEEATRAINANTDTKRRLVKRMQILHNNCQPSKTS